MINPDMVGLKSMESRISKRVPDFRGQIVDTPYKDFPLQFHLVQVDMFRNLGEVKKSISLNERWKHIYNRGALVMITLGIVKGLTMTNTLSLSERVDQGLDAALIGSAIFGAIGAMEAGAHRRSAANIGEAAYKEYTKPKPKPLSPPKRRGFFKIF